MTRGGRWRNRDIFPCGIAKTSPIRQTPQLLKPERVGSGHRFNLFPTPTTNAAPWLLPFVRIHGSLVARSRYARLQLRRSVRTERDHRGTISPQFGHTLPLTTALVVGVYDSDTLPQPGLSRTLPGCGKKEEEPYGSPLKDLSSLKLGFPACPAYDFTNHLLRSRTSPRHDGAQEARKSSILDLPRDPVGLDLLRASQKNGVGEIKVLFYLFNEILNWACSILENSITVRISSVTFELYITSS